LLWVVATSVALWRVPDREMVAEARRPETAPALAR